MSVILIPVLIVTIMGLVLGLGLALAAKFMAVPTDEREAKIRECLPGANCGACGYSGCDGYAAAIASGEVKPDKCAPGGTGTASALAEILGVEISTTPKVAFVACQKNSKNKYEYTGKQTCLSASLIHGGPLECQFGCIGFGDCAAACQFGAITLQDGKPVVCEDLCAGCGACAAVCPKSLISIIPKASKTRVLCSNCHKGPNVVKVCTTSCIACGMCVKACENDAIKLENNVAVIDPDKCINCGKCKGVCKRKAII